MPKTLSGDLSSIVLHECTNWLAVNKPTNFSTHGAFPGDLAAYEWLSLYLYDSTPGLPAENLYVCSRLDKGTSGALLFAKTKWASGEAQRIHEQELAEKWYLFISDREPQNATQNTLQNISQKEVESAPQKDSRAFSATEKTPIEGKPAQTSIEKIASLKLGSVHCSLYLARIARGRTHQIRIHASRLGVPLLGDVEYGGTAHPRLMLHCWRVHWPVSLEEGKLCIEAPVPQSFGGQEISELASEFMKQPARELRQVVTNVALHQKLFDQFPNDFVLQLLACLDRRLNWIEGISTATRAVHRNEIQVEGGSEFAIDKYGDYLCIWNYEDEQQAVEGFRFGLPAKQLNFSKAASPFEKEKSLAGTLSSQMNTLMHLFGAKGAVLRTISKNPHARGLVSAKIEFGLSSPEEFVVEEGGSRYYVSLTQRQHLGLFLDQRDNRRRFYLESKGKRCLNLFSYSCSFSVCAAKAGCEVVFSVDAAASALSLGKRNFELNSLAEQRSGKFVQEDVRKFLQRQLKKIEGATSAESKSAFLFDLIVCDPPTFSIVEGKGAFHVEKEWQELVQLCGAIVKIGGVVYFSNNHRTGHAEKYHGVLESVFSKVERLSPPFDFPAGRMQMQHVNLFRCVK